jgi:long-chain fatty acid transport protein
MTRSRFAGWALGLAAMLLAAPGRSGGIYFPYLGARASGMGTAFVGRADDASALFHNPAGMLLIKDDEVSANLHLNFPDFEYTRRDGDVVFDTVRNEKAFNPQPYVAYVSSRPAQRYSAGTAVYAAWGGLPDYPERGPQRYHLDYLHLIIVHGTVAGAYRLAPGLFVGAGASLIYGSLGQRKSIDARDLLGLDERVLPGADDPENEIVATVSTTDWGFGAHFGLLYQPSPWLRLGAAYTLPTTLQFSGTIQSDVSRVHLLSLLIGDKIDAKAKIDQPLPQVLRLGLAIAPDKPLSLAADWTWQGWSVAETNTVNIADQPLLEALVGDIVVPRFWMDSWSLAAGIEYKIRGGHAVRGGFYFDKGAIPSSTVLVDDPDADKRAFSAGGTIQVRPNLWIDVSGEYRKYDDVDVRDSVYDFRRQPEPNYVGASSDGLYRSAILNLSVGLRYRFRSGGV